MIVVCPRHAYLIQQRQFVSDFPHLSGGRGNLGAADVWVELLGQSLIHN
jgi:hypothetical protein